MCEMPAAARGLQGSKLEANVLQTFSKVDLRAAFCSQKYGNIFHKTDLNYTYTHTHTLHIDINLLKAAFLQLFFLHTGYQQMFYFFMYYNKLSIEQF